jgi:DNA-binding protein HU-beta
VKGAKPNHSRPHRSVNIGRLGDALGQDVLGAALGLTDEALGIVIQGRGHAREDQYLAHLLQRLKEAGIPGGWSETEDAPLKPEYLKALREIAAAAQNKAPIRRSNFKRLAKAFNGRTEMLADALEMVAPSISNVADGRLEFDDGRFGHVNPRLMEAGFPDGWLEQAEPELTDAMLAGLESLANDAYERELAEADDDLKHAEGQAFVGDPSNLSVQPVAAPVDTSQETAMATAAQRQGKSTSATAKPTFTPPSGTFKGAAAPGGARPMAHPTSGGAKIPRTVLAGGRQIGSAAVPAAKKASATHAPAAPHAAPARAAHAAQAPAKKAATKTTPPAAKKSATAAKKTSAATKKTPAHTPAPAPAAAPAPAPAQASNARGTISKEVSLARAKLLDQLLETARRGAKVTLWRDILGPGLAYWGNIRRGAVLFRDELAQGAIQAMGLPEDWFENPTFPPTTMAAWVTDPEAPVPTALEANANAQGEVAPKPAPTYPKPFARKTAPRPPQLTTTKAPTSAPVFKPPVFTPPNQAELPGIGAEAAEAIAAAAPVAQPAAAQPAAQPVAQTTAPAPAQAAPVHATTSHTPMVDALLSLIHARAAAGTLTDAAAMQLIHTLSAV